MSLIITGEYFVDIDTIRCNFVAAFNPVIVNVQRWDYDVLSIIFDSGIGYYKVTVIPNAVELTHRMTVGDMVYIKTPLNDGFFGVISISGPGEYHFYIDGAVEDFDTGSCFNPNYPEKEISTYKVYFHIKYNSVISHSASCFIDSYGQCSFDISGYLRNFDQFSTSPLVYNQINCNDESLQQFIEVDVFGSEEDADVITLDVQAVNAALQYYDTYDSNMVRNFVWWNNPLGSTAKFLTDIERPILFVLNGEILPFDVGILINELVTCVAYVGQYDVSHTPVVSNTSTDLDGAYNNMLNRIYVSALMKLSDGTSYVTMDLRTNRFVTPTVIFTETLYFDVRRYCSRLIYIRWLNTQGAYSYMGFNLGQELIVDVEDTITINKYIEHTNIDSSKRIIKQTKKRIVTGRIDAININQAYGLSIMPASVELYYYESLCGIPYTNTKWIKCIIEKIETNMYNRTNLREAAIQLQLPELKTQRF